MKERSEDCELQLHVKPLKSNNLHYLLLFVFPECLSFEILISAVLAFTLIQFAFQKKGHVQNDINKLCLFYNLSGSDVIFHKTHL